MVTLLSGDNLLIYHEIFIIKLKSFNLSILVFETLSMLTQLSQGSTFPDTPSHGSQALPLLVDLAVRVEYNDHVSSGCLCSNDPRPDQSAPLRSTYDPYNTIRPCCRHVILQFLAEASWKEQVGKVTVKSHRNKVIGKQTLL